MSNFTQPSSQKIIFFSSAQYQYHLPPQPVSIQIPSACKLIKLSQRTITLLGDNPKPRSDSFIRFQNTKLNTDYSHFLSKLEAYETPNINDPTTILENAKQDLLNLIQNYPSNQELITTLADLLPALNFSKNTILSIIKQISDLNANNITMTNQLLTLANNSKIFDSDWNNLLQHMLANHTKQPNFKKELQTIQSLINQKSDQLTQQFNRGCLLEKLLIIILLLFIFFDKNIINQ